MNEADILNAKILVIDDGSKDETKAVLNEKFGDLICYLYKENGGVSSARNYGIKNAQGKYIAFLDADDVWMSEKLEFSNTIKNELFRDDMGISYI